MVTCGSSPLFNAPISRGNKFQFFAIFSLSRTNSLVPCEFEIEQVHCISIFDFKHANADWPVRMIWKLVYSFAEQIIYDRLSRELINKKQTRTNSAEPFGCLFR